jgi:uncharacterized protein (TIGR02996 family)
MPRYALDGDIWQIVQTATQLDITTGGKTTVRKFQTPEQASAQLDKLVGERVAAGYELVTANPRHPQLEAVIASEPESGTHYAVYGDWLESHGDPRGRLIALQLAADLPGAPAKLATAFAKHLREHAEDLLGALAAHAGPDRAEDPVFGWRFGFIHQAYLHAERQAPLDRVLELLLEHASGRFLVDLAMVRNERMQAAVDVLGRLAPPSLRALRLWGVEQLDLGAVWPRMPELRRLSLTGSKLALGDLAVPRLERLELVDAEMPNASTRTLARMPWPVLQQLKLDFGHGYVTGDASIDDVFALLARRDLPALSQVALLHTRYIPEVVRELAASPIAGQLKILDLSNNQMEDAHARELAKRRAQFPQLTHLDVSFNRLTSLGLDALRDVAANVRGVNQLADA